LVLIPLLLFPLTFESAGLANETAAGAPPRKAQREIADAALALVERGAIEVQSLTAAYIFHTFVTTSPPDFPPEQLRRESLPAS
jgi:hypothetical protein